MRCKGYCRAQSQLNSFAMQITNSLWHRLLHLLPEPSEVWSFFKLSYKISVTAICHTLISHHLTWKVMQYFTKVWIIMCIKYLVLPNFRVFQVIQEPFLNIISNISSYFRGIQKSTLVCHQGRTFLFFLWPTVESVQIWKQMLC